MKLRDGNLGPQPACSILNGLSHGPGGDTIMKYGKAELCFLGYELHRSAFYADVPCGRKVKEFIVCNGLVLAGLHAGGYVMHPAAFLAFVLILRL
jgi:hypothetical protein